MTVKRILAMLLVFVMLAGVAFPSAAFASETDTISSGYSVNSGESSDTVAANQNEVISEGLQKQDGETTEETASDGSETESNDDTGDGEGSNANDSSDDSTANDDATSEGEGSDEETSEGDLIEENGSAEDNTDSDSNITEDGEEAEDGSEEAGETEEENPDTEDSEDGETSGEESEQAPAEEEIPEEGMSTFALGTISSYTETGKTFFDLASPNYTVVLSRQIAVSYGNHTGYVRNMGWHYQSDPNHTLYCIEPHKDFAASVGGAGSIDYKIPLNDDGSWSYGKEAWYEIPDAQRRAMALILLYSEAMWDYSYDVKSVPRDSNPNVGLRTATQLMIWEIRAGMRNPTTFACSDDSFYSAATGVYNFKNAYAELETRLKGHSTVIPSFTSKYYYSAPAIELTGTTTVVTDTNGVLPDWNFQVASEVQFDKVGNQLYITQKGPISESTVYAAVGAYLPDPELSTYNLWYCNWASSYQTCISVNTFVTDPLRAYFSLKGPDGGDLTINKATNTGTERSNWSFKVYEDANLTQLYGTYTTGSNGSVTISNIPAGTYYVKEEPGARGENGYWICDTATKEVTVTSSGSSSVTFTNNLYGKITFKKQTNTGTDLGGWKIGLYSDAACTNLVGEYVTAASGQVTTDKLTATTYYAREISGGNDYWTMDPAVKTISVTAGATTEASFSNSINGRIQIRKSTNTGANLGGWVFGIYNDAGCTTAIAGSPFTTQDDGTITTGNISAGTYYVREESGGNDFWNMDLEVKAVSVAVGQTAEVSFTNTQCGRVRIVKRTNTGANLGGWSFGIYTDANCTAAIEGSPFTSQADGTITTANILPGTYYVREESTRDEFWTYDEEVKQIAVAAGAVAEVSFTNTHHGKIKIVKSMDTDGELAGWEFKVTDSEGNEIGTYTSDENGEITTGILLPGEYTIEELIPADSLFFCKTQNPVTVTVTEGQTTEAGFTNALRPGKIVIEKVNYFGQHLADAKFCIEWSTDGMNWYTLSSFQDEDVRMGYGKCEAMANGIVVTDETGIITIENLYPLAQYRITELEAPEGYVKLADYAYVGELPGDDLTVELTVYNSRGYVLPSTGVEDGFFMVGIGVMIMTGAMAMGAYFLMNEKKKNEFLQ